MAKAKPKATVKWVIDLHGMLAVLRSRKNSSKVAIIDAIECGEMQVLKGVSQSLCDAYPDEYEDFKLIKNKKYMQVTVSTMEAAGVLMQRYGSSFWGSIPGMEHFHSMAAAMKAGCKLVSSGKAHSECNSIVKKCKLDKCLVEVEAFA